MTENASSSSKTGLIAAGVALAGAAIAVLFVLPAETGWDPTGVGKATGLIKIANPDNAELERGMARMEQETVLELSETPLEPADGVTDVFETELEPFQSVEFKYTIPEGAPMVFRWEANGPLNYDMHAHPFEGGEDLTESYGVDEASMMQGRYTPAFTGIHGWFWENRSLETVKLRLEASGGMTNSTLFGQMGEVERPLEGAEGGPEGTIRGHQMQGSAEE